MNNQELQKRINYQGNLKVLLSKISHDYNLGEYLSHEVNLVGYEDFNVALKTQKGMSFVKIFSDYRSIEDCHRFIDIINIVTKAGVNHPKLFTTANGQLYEYKHENGITRLCVMEYVDGDSFYGLKREPSEVEILAITDMAAKINSIKYMPTYLYDSWAVPNILKEFENTKKYLDPKDKEIIAPLIEKVMDIDFNTLPHSFVHGDMIKTNILLDKNNNLHVVDFSVSNNYPRIQELAILFVNMFFNEKDLNNYKNIYDSVLNRYQETVHLTDKEIKLLPFYIQLAHAMHIIGASREKGLKGDSSEENNYWLNLGRTGLDYVKSLNG